MPRRTKWSCEGLARDDRRGTVPQHRHIRLSRPNRTDDAHTSLLSARHGRLQCGCHVAGGAWLGDKKSWSQTEIDSAPLLFYSCRYLPTTSITIVRYRPPQIPRAPLLSPQASSFPTRKHVEPSQRPSPAVLDRRHSRIPHSAGRRDCADAIWPADALPVDGADELTLCRS